MLGNYPSRIGRAGRQSHLDGHIWQLVFIQIGQRLNPAKVKKIKFDGMGDAVIES